MKYINKTTIEAIGTTLIYLYLIHTATNEPFLISLGLMVIIDVIASKTYGKILSWRANRTAKRLKLI